MYIYITLYSIYTMWQYEREGDTTFETMFNSYNLVDDGYEVDHIVDGGG